MKLVDVEQGTDEWINARMGVITASRFKEVVTPSRCEPSKSCDAYRNELVAERFGVASEPFKSRAMELGTELEPIARSIFEFITGLNVQEVGIVLSDCGRVGVSPDGLIGEDCGLEIKCPLPKTHIKYLLSGKLPIEYKAQVMGCLAITERKFWYFMSYCPGLPPLILKIKREEEYIAKLKKHLFDFADSVDEVEKKIRVRM